MYGSTIPGQDTERLRIGLQFALNPDSSSSSFTDTGCNRAFRSPRLTFPAHTAPLDVKFNGSDAAFVALHGSWNRQPPIGYQVVRLAFSEAGGDSGWQPADPATALDPFQPVLWNKDLMACPTRCFRPTGLAVGRRGELYVTGDSTGDLWVITRRAAGGTQTDRVPSSATGRGCPGYCSSVSVVVLVAAVAALTALTAMAG